MFNPDYSAFFVDQVNKVSAIEIINYECKKVSVDPAIIQAIITTESAWDPWATRFESGFINLTSPLSFSAKNKITLPTEKMLQKTSWGLGQIMGGTARWLGYDGPLTALTDKEINIKLTCLYYSKLSARYKTDPERIAAYNAGSVSYTDSGVIRNQDYVDKVMGNLLKT